MNRKFSNTIVLTVLSLLMVVSLGNTSQAQGFPNGGVIYTTGGDITITINPSNSNVINYIFLVDPLTDDPLKKYIYIAWSEYNDWGTTITLSLGNYPCGTELIFKIFHDHLLFLTGPGSRNPDRLIHAHVTWNADGSATIRFEDTFGGGDRDFDDAVFTVRGAICSGDDCCDYEGCTPGYWKNHLDSWVATGYSPTEYVSDVFGDDLPSILDDLMGKTLLQALSFGGGSGVTGGAKILLRAAVAALLNASHPDVDYPYAPQEIIDDVKDALASNNRTTMLTLAAELDSANNLGCPLN
ncbi:MAG: DUF4114 domain-containing protein [bacterium]